MKKIISFALSVVLLLSIGLLPSAEAVTSLGDLETATVSLSDFIALCEEQSGDIGTRAVSTPLTSVLINYMFYGIVSYDFASDSLTYYIDYYGYETFSSSTVGKSPTGVSVPDIIGDYMFLVVETGWAVTSRSATWNSSTAKTTILGWDTMWNTSGISVGRYVYVYVDNNDAQTTTSGTFNYTARNFNTTYGGDYSRSDYCVVS